MKKALKIMRLEGLEVHPLATLFENENTEFYDKLWSEFGDTKTSAATHDGKVLSYIEDFNLAVNAGITEMPMNVVEVDELEALVMICYHVFYHKKPSYVKLYQAIKYIDQKLLENKGSKWYKELRASSGKRRNKLSKLVNESEGKISYITQIGDNKPQGLEMIDAGLATIEELIEAINNRERHKRQSTGSPSTPPSGIDFLGFDEPVVFDPDAAKYMTNYLTHHTNQGLVDISVSNDGNATATIKNGGAIPLVYHIDVRRDYKNNNRVGMVKETFIFPTLFETLTIIREFKEETNEKGNH